jgi:antitoxin CptB
MTADPEMSRLRWRCRRGMRELDMLLLNYLDNSYMDAEPVEQQAFRRLLTTPDPDILALLTGRAHTDDEQLSYVIKRLLERPRN